VLSPLKMVAHCLKALLEVSTIEPRSLALADDLEEQVGSALVDMNQKKDREAIDGALKRMFGDDGFRPHGVFGRKASH
jgi:hypothetical protein